jgi:hypothetical protein
MKIVVFVSVSGKPLKMKKAARVAALTALFILWL